MNRRKILFVDDDFNVLEGLRRTFRPMRAEWALAFAKSGREALDLLSHVLFDVVVADLRIQGMDGVEFLTEVMDKHPLVVRIVLTGQTDNDMALKSLNPAHQYLTKPYNTQKLKVVLQRAVALRDRLTDENLRSLVSKMDTLPSIPALYNQLMQELNSEEPSIHTVAEIIAQDVGMTAKVMQLVNSAFFGACQNIDDPIQAVARLGLETVQGLVLSGHVFSELETSKLKGFSADRLWNHSMATGAYSREVARSEKADRVLMGDSFIAGMLHDAGQLILAANLPDDYAKILQTAEQQQVTISDAELMVLGATHAEVGAYLLGLWGLSNQIVEAVAFHHHPEQCGFREKSPLTFVHAGDALEHEIEGDGLDRMSLDYLNRLGMADKVDGWRKVCSACAQAV
jgi:HD-like signal output (HDOD) protein/CheY-like chemotaxis protein